MASLREVGIAVAAFLVEYVAVFVVSKNLVEVEVASDTDDLPAGVVAFAGVVFDYDYIVWAAVDVLILAGYVVLFVVVAVNDLGVPAVAHVDAWCLRNNMSWWSGGFCLSSVRSLCLVFASSKTNCWDLNSTLLSLTISE